MFVIPVQEYNFHIHILPVLMEKIFQEVQNRLIGDMTTYNNMPKKMN